MKPRRFLARSILVVSCLFAPGSLAPAHAIEVIPLAYEFGQVEIGASSRTYITIVNDTGHSHILTRIAFSSESSPDFSIATPLDLPMTLESLDSLDLEVVFSPSAAGLCLAGLEIVSIDNSIKIVVVSLRGGTGTAPPPGVCAPSLQE